MNDTRPETARAIAARMEALTPAERLAKACSMFDLAREIAVATLAPGDAGDFEYRLFVRLYGPASEPLARAAFLRDDRRPAGGA